MSLTVSRLYKQFSVRQGTFAALKDINLEVNWGELVCIVGASGSGKSTLLRLIAGLDRPSAGEICVDGLPVTAPGADRGMVFQRYTLYPWMTVAQNVGFGLNLQGVPRSDRQQQVCHYLDVVGLSQFAESYPKELSGGMKQRVAIARVLACEPKILLLDEPFGALDIQTKETMQQFLLQVWRQTGVTILMITHDIEEAVFLAQRVYVMSAHPGTIKQELIMQWLEDKTEHGYHQIRRSPKFQNYRQQIADLLQRREDLICDEHPTALIREY
ncbi:MAG: ABC transporter ATP-binding protein [Stenomitos rutilans HA7619-LM2]|jgi:NitT/TauT family transport system ATP-binding protein|nr:ABC transporter ATP-binding protein [Stenomitos rutilans HA7619-LM2]